MPSAGRDITGRMLGWAAMERATVQERQFSGGNRTMQEPLRSGLWVRAASLPFCGSCRRFPCEKQSSRWCETMSGPGGVRYLAQTGPPVSMLYRCKQILTRRNSCNSKSSVVPNKVDETGAIPACFAWGTGLLARTPGRAGTRSIWKESNRAGRRRSECFAKESDSL